MGDSPNNIVLGFWNNTFSQSFETMHLKIELVSFYNKFKLVLKSKSFLGNAGIQM